MSIPTEHDDPINAKILSVSEDMISGFQEAPFQEIARKAEIDLDIVLERIQSMLRAGVIRRVRQTLLATKQANKIKGIITFTFLTPMARIAIYSESSLILFMQKILEK